MTRMQKSMHPRILKRLVWPPPTPQSISVCGLKYFVSKSLSTHQPLLLQCLPFILAMLTSVIGKIGQLLRNLGQTDLNFLL